jgi:hypothetical protein
VNRQTNRKWYYPQIMWRRKVLIRNKIVYFASNQIHKTSENFTRIKHHNGAESILKAGKVLIQLVKKFNVFMESVFSRARHRTVSWAAWIQSTTYSFAIIFSIYCAYVFELVSLFRIFSPNSVSVIAALCATFHTYTHLSEKRTLTCSKS